MSDDALPASDERSNPAAGEQESAAEREARYLRAIDQVKALQRAADAQEAPGKYSLLELMVVVTLLAVVLGLIRLLGMWGAVLTFLGCVGWTLVIYPRWHPADRSRQAAMFDGIWGMVMPLVCLACDPFVFKEHQELVDAAFDFKDLAGLRPQFHREALVVYAFVGWQMLLLGLWIATRPSLNRLAGFFLGTWALGILFAGVLAALLAIPAAIGSVVGIGLLGFTPIFTSYTLGRRMREAVDAGIHLGSDQSVAVYWLLAAFGFMAAILVPMQIATMWKLPIAP
jgi:hypothetical protein